MGPGRGDMERWVRVVTWKDGGSWGDMEMTDMEVRADYKTRVFLCDKSPTVVCVAEESGWGVSGS